MIVVKVVQVWYSNVSGIQLVSIQIPTIFRKVSYSNVHYSNHHCTEKVWYSIGRSVTDHWILNGISNLDFCFDFKHFWLYLQSGNQMSSKYLTMNVKNVQYQDKNSCDVLPFEYQTRKICVFRWICFLGFRYSDINCNNFVGCGTRFAPYINEEMMELILRSLHHTNRFVRESGFQTCSTLIEAASEDVYSKFGIDFASHLAEGLADNWSQVRLAALGAARYFTTSSFGLC